MTLSKFNLIVKFIHHLRLFISIHLLQFKYLINVGLGLGEDTKGGFVLFNLCFQVSQVCERNSFTKKVLTIQIEFQMNQLNPLVALDLLFSISLLSFINFLMKSTQIVMETWCQFHPHFTCAFCANIFAPKSYKAKAQLQKSCVKHFCTKNC